jgi:hypothetical protein
LIINSLGQDVYDFTSGSISSSIRLDDGTVSSPALFFDSDSSVGLYKSDLETLAIASSSNKVFDFTKDVVNSYKKYVIQNSLISSAVITTNGNYYRAGSFSTPLSGGSGDGGYLQVDVSAFAANITNSGSGYPAGTLTDVTITGGSGVDGTADLTVAGIEGIITNGGTGYPADISYVDVPFTNGSGTGGLADVVVNSSGVISSVIVSDSGSGYQNGDVLTFANADLNYVDSEGNAQSSNGSNFSYTITNVPYIVTQVVPSVNWSGSGYLIGNVCGVSGTSTGFGLSFTLTDVGFIDAITAVADGGSGYSIGDQTSPTVVFGSQDQWNGIVTSYTINVQVQDIGGGINRYFLDIGDGNGYVQHPNLNFERDAVYNFVFPDPDDYVEHPLQFSRLSDGLHNASYVGPENDYTTDVRLLTEQTGIQIYIGPTVPSTLYYFCAVHPDMVGTASNAGQISIDSLYGQGAVFEITDLTTSESIALNLDGSISSGSVSIDGNAIVTGNGSFGGSLVVSGVSTLNSLNVLNSLTAGTLTIDDTFDVTGSTSIGESLIVNTDQFVVDHESGFIGINASDFILDPILNPLEYSLELYGSFYNDGNVILSESASSYVNIGDTSGTSKLNVGGGVEISGEIKSSGNISLNSSVSLAEPSLYFSDNRKVGLYYEAEEDFLSITGYTGELSSFKHDSLNFYRDSNFNGRNIDEYLIVPGSGYTLGNYSDVEFSGGVGSGLIANVTVAFSTSTTNPGEGYTSGQYTSVPLSGTNGNGAIADITISSGNIVDNIQITNAGSGYETTPLVSFTDASGEGAAAVARLSESASLKNIILNSSGSGYTSAPTVIIGTEWSSLNTVEVGQQYFYGSNLYTVTFEGTFGSTPPTHTSGVAFNGSVELTYAGSVATATANLGTDVGVNDDSISFIIVDSFGSGYTSVPEVIISGDGEGAEAVAILGYTIDSISVLDGGSGYVSPVVVFTGGNPDTSAVASPSVTNQGVSKVVITDPGTGYVVGETLTFSEVNLVDDQGSPSAAPTIAASLQVLDIGSVTVVDITDFGFGYEENDVIVFDSVTAPGNTGGQNFQIEIKSTVEENIVNIDVKNSLLTSTGIKSLDGGINVNDNISIGDSGLSKSTSGNLILSAIDYVQVAGSKAFILPSGTTEQRPGLTASGVGAIRYNTSEGRFEGFNGSFFVSLGGVRDVDGNTYISAELNPGDDDNTLRFFNEDVQSMQVEQTKITLQTIADIVRTDVNNIEEWQPLSPVTAPADPINDPPVLIYYDDRVYSVDNNGTFSASTPPSHTSGTSLNGTVNLTYVRSIYGSVVYKGADLNLTLDKINLNTNGLRISSDNTVSAKLITEAPDFIIGFTNTDDPLLKLSFGGGLSINTGFGGVENYIQVLDYELKQFDLKDTRVISAVGSIDTSVGNAVNIIIAEYDVQTSTLPLHSGKLMVEIVDDSATPKRQYSEISYLTKSDLSDILYTETNKIYSDDELCDVSVGIDNSNNITCDIVDLTGSTTTVYSIKVVSQAILV